MTSLLVRSRALATYFVAWTPLVLLYAVLVGSSARLSVAGAIGAALTTVGAAAVLGLPARRYIAADPWRGRPTASFLLRHFLAALLYAISWSASILAAMRPSVPSWSAVFEDARGWIGWQSFFGVVLYAMMASIAWIGSASRRAQDEARQRQQAEALRARAELEALRGRLDPHFLFNTLHSLTILVRRDPARAEVALGQLAELLRYVLDSKRGARDQVTLADELGFVRAYLALEMLRFGDRLRVETSVDEEALDFAVPSLTLQPLVENAIKHAVSPRADGGRVQLSATFADASLRLEVRDDGPGSTDAAGTGIGLDALRRRLALFYGDRARVDTRQGADGFAVVIEIPA